MKLVLDQAAVSVLTGGPSKAKNQVRRAMRAAARLRRGVTVPMVTLAEFYRGASRRRVPVQRISPMLMWLPPRSRPVAGSC